MTIEIKMPISAQFGYDHQVQYRSHDRDFANFFQQFIRIADFTKITLGALAIK